MYQNPKKTIRKPSDNKHRLFEILSQIKESISKRRFNHAYEMGSKYYEQNKTILTNEQIYQLSLNCCKAIQNKLYHRLTIKKKKYVPPVTKSLIQHLFSLQMSLHSVLLPQLVKLDEKHFNMLSVQNQGINPKDISIQEITFQRKSNDFFLDNSKVTKQVKRLIKKHLKVCNTVLMYKLKYPKNKNQIKEIFQIMEDIYQHFEEHDFPSQHMDYVLIKLSLIEVEGSNQDIPCTYKLPLGFLAKLYQKIRKNKQNGIQYYLNKLGSFLLLAFRHLPISIEDMFVLTNQIQYITKILNKQYEENSNTGTIFKKKQGLNYKRQVTIDNQPYEVSVLRLSKRVESTSTQSKLSQKKMESKRNIQNTYKSLRILAQTALQQIEYSMNSRRQVLQIVLKYFTMSYLQKSRANDSDQILSSEAVLLNTNSQNNKKNNFRENIQSGSSSQKKARTNFQSLTCLLQDIRIKKNSSSLEQVNEEQKMKFRKTMKQQGKFITRNVELVSRQSGLKIGYFNVVNNLLRSIESYERNLLSDDLTLDKDDVLQDFQLDRLEKIRSYKEKLKVKPNKFEKNMREHKQQILQIPNYKKKQSQKINLLNDVVQNNVIKLLQLPFNEFTSKNRSYSNPVFKKLEGLKLQTQNLNTQRKYLVQKLKARKILCLTQHNTQIYQNQTKLTQKQFKKQKENFDQISQFSQNLTQKMDKYIQNNKKLMKIEKDSKSTFITKFLNKPKIKLKLENQKTKKLPQITFQKLQKQYNKLQGKLQKDKIDWELTLSSQFDKLRRDAAKNQFSNQNQRRHKNQNIKMSNNTINQIVLDDQPQNFN